MYKKSLIALLCLSALVSCQRIPSSVFSLADGSEASAISVDGNSGTVAERDLGRLNNIDASIDESLDRLSAALDPNSAPANLDKLVVGDKVDPGILNERGLSQQAQIEQKFDQKNQDLIDNVSTGNLDNVSENSGLNPDNFSDRDRKQQAQIDQKLDSKADSQSDDSLDSETQTDSESQDSNNSDSGLGGLSDSKSDSLEP